MPTTTPGTDWRGLALHQSHLRSKLVLSPSCFQSVQLPGHLGPALEGRTQLPEAVLCRTRSSTILLHASSSCTLYTFQETVSDGIGTLKQALLPQIKQYSQLLTYQLTAKLPFIFQFYCFSLHSVVRRHRLQNTKQVSVPHILGIQTNCSASSAHVTFPGEVRWALLSCRQVALLPELPALLVISLGSFACLLRAVKRLFISWQFINMYWAWRMSVKQLLFLFLKKIKHDKLSYSCKPSACYLWLCRIQMVKLSEWVHSSK